MRGRGWSEKECKVSEPSWSSRSFAASRGGKRPDDRVGYYCICARPRFSGPCPLGIGLDARAYVRDPFNRLGCPSSTPAPPQGKAASRTLVVSEHLEHSPEGPDRR